MSTVNHNVTVAINDNYIIVNTYIYIIYILCAVSFTWITQCFLLQSKCLSSYANVAIISTKIFRIFIYSNSDLLRMKVIKTKAPFYLTNKTRTFFLPHVNFMWIFRKNSWRILGKSSRILLRNCHWSVCIDWGFNGYLI